jgi:hypothetical protein
MKSKRDRQFKRHRHSFCPRFIGLAQAQKGLCICSALSGDGHRAGGHGLDRKSHSGFVCGFAIVRSLTEETKDAECAVPAQLRIKKAITDVALGQDISGLDSVIADLLPQLADEHTKVAAVGDIARQIENGMETRLSNRASRVRHQ